MSARSRRDPIATTLSTHRIRNAAIAERIVASTGLAPPSLVVEVGAGDGILTAALAARCVEVIAVERDRMACRQLHERFATNPQIAVHPGDFLQFHLPTRRPYVLFGNPPFAVTSAILRHALGAPTPPVAIHLVVQREAAFRWGGFDRESIPSISTKLDYAPELRLALRRRDFDPPPVVDCVLLSLVRRSPPLLAGARRAAFLALTTRALLSSRRTAARALEGCTRPLALSAAARHASVDLDVAPGQVTFEEWIRLFDALRPPSAPRRAAPR